MSDIKSLVERLRFEHGRLTSQESRPTDYGDAADLIEQQAARIAEFERILDGLPQDAIDGGWTARGISAYAKKLEARIAELAKDAERYRWLRDPENAEGPNMVASSDPEELDAAIDAAIDAALAASEPKKD